MAILNASALASIPSIMKATVCRSCLANEGKFLLTLFFLFASVNLYAQEYDLSEVEDCRVVVLKCKLHSINKKEVKENNNYTIRVVTKQGGAGWLQVFVKDHNGKSVTSYQSPKSNCYYCEKKKLTDLKHDNEVCGFYGKSNSGYMVLNYCSTKSSVQKSKHFISLAKSKTDDFSNSDVYHYTIFSCDFYQDKNKEHSIVEREPYIENYLPNLYDYKDNLLYAFFKDKYYYYK